MHPTSGTTNQGGSSGDRNASILLLLTIAAVIISFLTIYQIGVARGFRDWIGQESYGRVRFAVGSAITEIRHGGYGHSLSAVVESLLITGGITEQPATLEKLASRFPDNLRDTRLINAAIRKAGNFKWPFDPQRDVRGSAGDDIGLVDYVKLGFRVFGQKIESLYYLYFVLLGASSIAFIYQFRHAAGMLPAIGIVSIAYIFVFSSNVFDVTSPGPGALSVADSRFLSGLVIVPGFHLGCLMLGGLAANRSTVALAIVQAAILVFTLLIRASAGWMIVCLMAVAAWVALGDVRRGAVWTRRLWPMGLLLLLWVGYSAYISLTLHPVYNSKGEISRHVIWHSIFYQLQFHPRWKETYAAEFDHAVFDELPAVAAKKYLLRNPPADPSSVYLAPDRKYLNYAAGETYARKAFFEFMRNDPRFVLESILIHNSAGVAGVLYYYSSSLGRVSWLVYVGLAIYLGTVSCVLSSKDLDYRDFVAVAMFAGFAFLVSLLPNWLIVSNIRTMADQFTMLLIGGLCMAALGLATVFRVARRGGDR